MDLVFEHDRTFFIVLSVVSVKSVVQVILVQGNGIALKPPPVRDGGVDGIGSGIRSVIRLDGPRINGRCSNIVEISVDGRSRPGEVLCVVGWRVEDGNAQKSKSKIMSKILKDCFVSLRVYPILLILIPFVLLSVG
jgi:hypothetical protein